jgi:hypothetical protein
MSETTVVNGAQLIKEQIRFLAELPCRQHAEAKRFGVLYETCRQRYNESRRVVGIE